VDQTRVRSGFDVEIALGERYLQYLLLLALDTGVIPVETTFGSPPITARLQVPPDLDRTYSPHPDAPQPEPAAGNAHPFEVTILPDHPLHADLRVNVVAHFESPPDGLDVALPIGLYVRLSLATSHGPDGALESAGLAIALVDVDGPVVDVALALRGITKEQILNDLRGVIDRPLDLTALGGRVQDLAIRRFAADGGTPASLALYLNLRLRGGPQPDNYLGPRGDVRSAQNIMVADADMVFATRADIYSPLGHDAFYRLAKPDGAGYHYPWRRKPSDPTSERLGTFQNITMEPVDNVLRVTISAEYDFSIFDPDFHLVADISPDTDDDGIMTWSSGTSLHTELLVDILLFAVTAILVALIPCLGALEGLLIMAGLEIAKMVAEEIVSEVVIDDLAQRRLDATLLDIAPNRLTLVRRRWDPWFATHHQIGLRPVGTAITDDGIAIWGRAALTRVSHLATNTVIRDTQRDADGAPTHLRYRVDDIDPVSNDLTVWAPGVDRGTVEQHDPVTEPYLFQLPVDEAADRVGGKRLIGDIPYLVKAVEFENNTVSKILAISERETKEQRNRLIAEHAEAAAAQITADHELEIREQVVKEFEDLGVIPTEEEIANEVAARLQALIDADVADYTINRLPDELEAAVTSQLRLELAPTHFGRLQSRDILTLKDYVPVHIKDGYYYRDHYIPSAETTKAVRLADNLRNKPRYHSTPTGPSFPQHP
jgi:hypothetical protein